VFQPKDRATCRQNIKKALGLFGISWQHHRHDLRRLYLACRSLRSRIEHAQGFQFVAKELCAERKISAGSPNVKHAATHGKRARRVDFRYASVTAFKKFLLNLGK
jgi:hypothetical protein